MRAADSETPVIPDNMFAPLPNMIITKPRPACMAAAGKSAKMIGSATSS